MKKYVMFFVVMFFLTGCKKETTVVGNEKSAESTRVEAAPLPSWKDGKTKQAIIDFVTKTTTPDSPYFVPVEDRIACFDNDGTLWGEQPMYFQLAFAIDYIKKLALEHPEWRAIQPYKAIIEGDMKTVLAGGEEALMKIVMVSHSRVTTEDFEKNVANWMATAIHPISKKHYNEMIYQPMVELLNYLRMNGYKTFIVSGGGIDFMRVWVEKAYGIPPYQVVGSSLKTIYQVGADGKVFLTKLPELNFYDDKEAKPIAIHQHIGKRPVFTAGNSDGDYQMLYYTTSGSGPRFGLLVHHTDSLREFAYDRDSHIGRLEKGLDDAAKNNWSIVDMKNDWKIIYPEK